MSTILIENDISLVVTGLADLYEFKNAFGRVSTPCPSPSPSVNNIFARAAQNIRP